MGIICNFNDFGGKFKVDIKNFLHQSTENIFTPQWSIILYRLLFSYKETLNITIIYVTFEVIPCFCFDFSQISFCHNKIITISWPWLVFLNKHHEKRYSISIFSLLFNFKNPNKCERFLHNINSRRKLNQFFIRQKQF